MILAEDVRELVRANFGESKDYIIVMKRNNPVKNLLKLLFSNLYYVIDNNRCFVLVFTERGIFEKEISFSVNGEFTLLPWHEVREFRAEKKLNSMLLHVQHLDQVIEYRMLYAEGRLMAGNMERARQLEKAGWHRTEI